MVDDVRDIQEFYNKAVEKEDGRLERHQLERDITWRYFEKYLPPKGSILEIGAATGAYTIPLAKKGYSVTAVDLAPNLVTICKKRVIDEGLEDKVNCYVADGRDLSSVPGKVYDAILMMGPLYHLVREEDRRKALKQAGNKLKAGGTIFSTFISRYGIWGDVMKDMPHHIEWPGWLQSIIIEGKQPLPPDRKGLFRAYFATPSEIVPLHEAVGFRTLALAGIEAGGLRDEVYNSLEGKRRQLWLDLLFSISTEKSIIGASNHLLYIGVKE